MYTVQALINITYDIVRCKISQQTDLWVIYIQNYEANVKTMSADN